ncbi:bifunctional (p)ppGpp synthetase/guanosine-3',5'-bis(diphosphate) 3'-pyrophosphohydrolase [Rickettsia sp. R2]
MITEIFNKDIAHNVETLTRIKIDTKISAADTINFLYCSAKIELIIVKLFDCLHNLQTLGAKSIEKQIKIIKETLISFLSIAITISYKRENKIVHLCLNALSALENHYDFYSNNNFQHLSLTFKKLEINFKIIYTKTITHENRQNYN